MEDKMEELNCLLIKTYKFYKENPCEDDTKINDEYYKIMNANYKDIDKCITDMIKDKRGKEKGKIFGKINKMLKKNINDEDLMMFILENLSEENACLDDF
jgi:hypothetical protein